MVSRKRHTSKRCKAIAGVRDGKMQQRFCSFGGARESLKPGPLSITIEDTAAPPTHSPSIVLFCLHARGGGKPQGYWQVGCAGG